MSVEENKALARRFFDFFNERTLDGVEQVIAQDIVGHRRGYNDLEGFKQYWSANMALCPDLHFTIHDVIAQEDKVALRWTGQGTTVTEFMGVPPNGKLATWTGMIVFRIADGKIVESWINTARLDILDQLGAKMVPPGGEGDG